MGQKETGRKVVIADVAIRELAVIAEADAAFTSAEGIGASGQDGKKEHAQEDGPSGKQDFGVGQEG